MPKWRWRRSDPMSNPPLARPPPTRQTASKERFNFLYLDALERTLNIHEDRCRFRQQGLVACRLQFAFPEAPESIPFVPHIT
jgi:hypothetical protein